MPVLLKKYTTKKGKDVPFLYQDQNGFFWARKRIGKSTPRKKLDTNVESVAIAKLFQTISEMEAAESIRALSKEERKKLQEKEAKELLFRDYYEKLINQKKSREIKEATLRRIDIIYRLSLEPFWGDLSASDIANNKDIATEFMNWHKEHRKGVQFVNVFKYLGNTFRLMQKEGALLEKDVPELIIPKTETNHHRSQKGRFVEYSEYTKIQENFDERYALIPKIAYWMGMRKMEIGELEADKIKKVNGKVIIDLSHDDTKTGLERIITVPDTFANELLDLKASADKYIFPAPTDLSKPISSQVIDKYWKSAKEAARIKGRLRFHDLRHTAASNMVKLGIDSLIIATYLGMSIVTLQKKYLKLKVEDLLIVNEKMLQLMSRGSR